METKYKEVVHHVTYYVATDGTEFIDKEQCEKYERTAECVISANYNKNVLKFAEAGDHLSCYSSDDNVDIFRIVDEVALNNLNMYLKNNCYTVGVKVGVYETLKDVELQHPSLFENGEPKEYYKNDVNRFIGKSIYKHQFIPLGGEYIGKTVAVFSYDGEVYKVATKGELEKEFKDNLIDLFNSEE